MSEMDDSAASLEVAGAILADALDLLDDHGQSHLADQIRYQTLKRLRRLQVLVSEFESDCLDEEPKGPSWEIPPSQLNDFTQN